ncbi:MAG: UTP--glucose-1-phosphate uridylyltransferase GalU [bacterium]|jgi:UTP--glucose-1-phosphate uridylyltransferase
MQPVRKAIIPAAGLGTRFLPVTKAQPKEMLPILDKPTIQYIVEEAIDSGIEDILIITGRGKRAIEDHFDRSLELERILAEKGQNHLLEAIQEIGNIEIHYIRQKQPLGLGHAIYCARKFIGEETFAVLLGDDIVAGGPKPGLKHLLDYYNDFGYSVIGVQEVSPQEVERYGIVRGEKVKQDLWRVKELVEKPPAEKAPSRVAIMGRYVITPRIFSLLEEAKPGAGGEIQLTDSLNRLAQEEPVYACTFAGKRYDAGDLLGYLQTTVEFALQREDIADEFAEFLQRVLQNR